MDRRTISAAALAVALFATANAPSDAADRPNIVFIYADDLGYGDLGCYGATAVKTPNVDRLATQGLRFTDAHSTSSTCTPSRFGFMTGEYPWRKKGTGILPGDAALVVDPRRASIASMMKRAGYATGAVGKWHLGLGDGKAPIDWNGLIQPGPREVGFDYSFIMPATADRVPCVFVENGRVVGLDPADPIRVSYVKPIGDEPTGAARPDLLRVHSTHGHDMAIVNGVGRIGYMTGGKAALWVDEDMADTFEKKAVAFVEKNRDRPFFLYLATHDVHVPRMPNARYVGSTPMGPRGDVIAQFDHSVGTVLQALDRLGLAEKTLVIVSSDNGPVVDDGYRDQAVEKLNGHRPSGPLRGGKYSLFEGGTRVAFVARWPGQIKPGTSDALVCQVDLFASLAKLAGQPLTEADAPDSHDVLDALLGRSKQGRDELVEHSGRLALRRGTWKFIPSGGGPKVTAKTNSQTGNDPSPQLYDLSADLGETQNLAAAHPDLVKSMRERLEALRGAGRSRP